MRRQCRGVVADGDGAAAGLYDRNTTIALLAQLDDASACDAVAVAALHHGWTQKPLADVIALVRGGGVLNAAHVAAFEGELVGDGDATMVGADDGGGEGRRDAAGRQVGDRGRGLDTST